MNKDGKAVFLDRDGTISRDVPYCSRVEDFEILPAVPEAIRLLKQNGFKVVVITNQSGVGRGYFTEVTLVQIHEHMEKELARHNARVDAIYYCPHHPDDGCECRKPKPGMLLKAADELGINFARSFMVGDSGMDIRAGKAVGCQTVLMVNGSNKEMNETPDYIAADLLKAAHWILSFGDER